MKIYNVVKVPQGLGYDDYEAIYQSGYTAGYEEGYNSATYCTIEALEDGNISIGNNVQYSINDEDWVSAASGDTIAVQTGDITRFKGINAGRGALRGSTVKCIAYGNVMSLLYGDDFFGKTEIGNDHAFRECFYECNNLADASNLILPATTLARGCYYGMFHNCTGLTTAPSILPATTLASNCYYYMFLNCTSLTAAPALPATELAKWCYQGMFQNCTSLTTSPELPATTLVQACYSSMFQGCTSLTTSPELPATTLTASCYNNMFQNCTSLTAAPELPATTLADYCYYYMFQGCTSLNYIKCLATDISTTNCTSNWVNGVQTNSGTFVKDANTTWPTGTGGIPENWTVEDAQ